MHASSPVDYLNAVAAILSAVAWPAVAVGLVWAFRRPIMAALPSLKKASLGSASLEFDRPLRETGVSIAESVTASEEKAGDGPTLTESLGGENPRTAIIRGYVAMEQWAVDHLPAHGVEARQDMRSRPLMSMVREAVDKRLLPPATVSQVQGLQTLRNLAAHSPTDPTTDQAAEFLVLADALLYVMQSSLEK